MLEKPPVLSQPREVGKAFIFQINDLRMDRNLARTLKKYRSVT